ncbi:MAG: GIY-YIG nuclease family protein, partial [Pseudomonadota bacterium]
MLGYPASKSASQDNTVDFRQQRGIYVLYDGNFNIVYVGQAGAGNQDLFGRLKNHLTDHLASRWSLFSWFGVRR